MSESFGQALDTPTLLHFRGPSDVRAIRASFAWHSIEMYLASARRQIDRIAKSLAEVELLSGRGERAEVWGAAQVQAFCDMHFYFVCWSRVADMIDVVLSDCGVQLDLPNERRRLLNHYREARHALEHVKDRLPGSGHKQRRRMSVPADLGNLRGDIFTFGGKEWDVGGASIARLEEIVDSLERQIRSALE